VPLGQPTPAPTLATRPSQAWRLGGDGLSNSAVGLVGMVPRRTTVVWWTDLGGLAREGAHHRALSTAVDLGGGGLVMRSRTSGHWRWQGGR
jgi:hypothetical protein